MSEYLQKNLFDEKADVSPRETYRIIESENVDIPSCHDCWHARGEVFSGYTCALLKRDVSYAGYCEAHEFKSPEHEAEYRAWARQWKAKIHAGGF